MSTNVERLKAAYKLWNDEKGLDTSGWLALISDKMRITSMASDAKALAFAAERSNREEAVAYMAAITKDWSMVHWTPETYVSEGNRVAVFGTCAWKSKATGKVADVRIAHLWEFEGDEAVSLTEIFDSARAVAAATPESHGSGGWSMCNS
jgi:ketosteroid isomerase-like protein